MLVLLVLPLPFANGNDGPTRSRPKQGGQPLEGPALRIERSGVQLTSHANEVLRDSIASDARQGSRGTPSANASPSSRVYPVNQSRVRDIDAQLQVAQRRRELAEQQLSHLASFNVWMPPQSQTPQVIGILPYSISYSPVHVAEPVQSFLPRSTFAHALVTAERQLEDARLAEAELIASRQAQVESSNPPVASSTTLNHDGSGPRSLPEIEATLHRERFLAESARVRLLQLENLSQLTYSSVYPSLWNKLQLAHLEHETNIQSLDAERNELLKAPASGSR